MGVTSPGCNVQIVPELLLTCCKQKAIQLRDVPDDNLFGVINKHNTYNLGTSSSGADGIPGMLIRDLKL